MRNAIVLAAATSSQRAAQLRNSRLGFVSPYLDQPIRSFEQAVTDALQLRCRAVLMAMVRGVTAPASAA